MCIQLSFFFFLRHAHKDGCSSSSISSSDGSLSVESNSKTKIQKYNSFLKMKITVKTKTEMLCGQHFV